MLAVPPRLRPCARRGSAALAALLVPLFAACNGDPSLNAGRPVLEVMPGAIDFGEVVVGNTSVIGIAVANTGYGLVEFDSVTFADGSSADFTLEQVPDVGIDHDEEGVLAVRYTPDVEGGDAATVLLDPTDETLATIEVPIEAIGVIPRIDLDPEVLYFGRVEPESTVTLPVRVGSSGSGDLHITHVGFSGGEDVAYMISLPETWEDPVSPGISFTMAVTFAPPDEAEYRGEIWLESNDPEDPIAVVELIGNTDDVPTEPQAPIVEILDPDNGMYFLDDMDVSLRGYVIDTDEANISNLVCSWSSGGQAVGAPAYPSATGYVESTAMLPAGALDVTLRCYDTTGEMGQDSAAIFVWPSDEPVLYTISGGDSVFDYFSVDDDISVLVNGVTIYADTDNTKGTLAPIEFEAQRGDTIEIVAVDHNYCDAVLDALVLHWGTGESQELNPEICLSACPDHACYDASYNGPWPGAYLDEEYVIQIP